MDGSDWLRTQLTSFGCAACGSGYGSDGIRVLAERDGLFFVDLACDACGSSATAIVTVGGDEQSLRAEDPELLRAGAGGRAAPAKPPARTGRPVSLDDLLDMHRVLAGWEGDMVGLLRRLDGVGGSAAR